MARKRIPATLRPTPANAKRFADFAEQQEPRLGRVSVEKLATLAMRVLHENMPGNPAEALPLVSKDLPDPSKVWDADGTRYFSRDAVERELNDCDLMSRSTIVLMSPADFLALAKPGYDESKQLAVNQLVREGTPFADVPKLFAQDNRDGTAQVDGHEGRHRARALQAQGVRQMPVVLRSYTVRWGQTNRLPEPFPAVLISEDGRQRRPTPPSALWPSPWAGGAERLPATRMPKVGYHVTRASRADAIHRDGFKAKGPGTYFWGARHYADWYRELQEADGAEMVTFRVDLDGLPLARDPEAEDMSEWGGQFERGEFGEAYIVPGDVPPDRILGVERLPAAPGYTSRKWRSQDWRVVVPGRRKPDVSYNEKCGGPSNRSASGKVRLCLPMPVISALRRDAEGRQILYEQAQRKARAKPGARIPWHPRIRALHRALEAQGEEDDPSKAERLPTSAHGQPYALPTISQEDAYDIVEEFIDMLPPSESDDPLPDYTWTLEWWKPSRLAGAYGEHPEAAFDYWESEADMMRDDGSDYRDRQAAWWVGQKGWKDPLSPPIIALEGGDTEVDPWIVDGWHRSALSISRGLPWVKVLVGRPKLQTGGGEKLRAYHGSERGDLTEFRDDAKQRRTFGPSEQAVGIFVSLDPDFANAYARGPEGTVYAVEVPDDLKLFWAEDLLAREAKYFPFEYDALNETGRALYDDLEDGKLPGFDDSSETLKSILLHDYSTIEHSSFTRWLRDRGYDGAWVREYRERPSNLLVFDRSRVRILAKAPSWHSPDQSPFPDLRRGMAEVEGLSVERLPTPQVSRSTIAKGVEEVVLQSSPGGVCALWVGDGKALSKALAQSSYAKYPESLKRIGKAGPQVVYLMWIEGKGQGDGTALLRRALELYPDVPWFLHTATAQQERLTRWYRNEGFTDSPEDPDRPRRLMVRVSGVG